MANITNGTVSVELTGGVGPYQYTLLSADNDLPIPQNTYPTFTNPVNGVQSNVFTFGNASDNSGNSGLAAGSYKVKIVDTNGCQTFSNTLIVSASTPTPTATAIPDPTATPVPDPTATPVPDPTATAMPDPTATPVPDPTATAIPDPTATAIPDPTATPVPDPTATAIPDPTATPVPTAIPLVLQPQRKVISGWNLMAGEPVEFINGLLNKTEQEHRDFFCNAQDISGVSHQAGDEARPYVLWTDENNAYDMPEVGNVFYADQQGTQYFTNSGFLWWNSGSPGSEPTNYYWVTIGSEGIATSIEQWAECPPDPTATPVPDPTATPVPDPTATPVPDPTATPVPPTATPVPTYSLNVNSPVVEGSNMTFTLTTTGLQDGDVVPFGLGGTATIGDDYSDVDPKEFVITNNSSTYTVTTFQDNTTEGGGNETVSLTLSPFDGQGNGTFSESVTGEIVDTSQNPTPTPTATPVPPTATPVPPTATPVPPTATPEPEQADAYYFHLGSGGYPYAQDLIGGTLYKADNSVAANYDESFADMLANPGSYEQVNALSEIVHGTSFTIPASSVANFYWLAIPVDMIGDDLTVHKRFEIDGAPADNCSASLAFVGPNGTNYNLYKLNTVPMNIELPIVYVVNN